MTETVDDETSGAGPEAPGSAAVADDNNAELVNLRAVNYPDGEPPRRSADDHGGWDVLPVVDVDGPAVVWGHLPMGSADTIDRWAPARPAAHMETELTTVQQAEQIRSTVRAELDESSVAVLAAVPETYAAGGLTQCASGAAAHHLAAGRRGFELPPIAALAAEVRDGIDPNIDPIGDELAGHVMEATQRSRRAARAGIAALTRPPAPDDHVKVAQALQVVTEHAGLLRFIELFG
jgi:hypothetical protein